MASEVLSNAGFVVHVYDTMPSVGHNFLLAGIGGLNITHAEPLEAFISRYGSQANQMRAWIERKSLGRSQPPSGQKIAQIAYEKSLFRTKCYPK
jgi:HI0933-like protein